MIHMYNIKGVAGNTFVKFNFVTEHNLWKFSDAKISQYTVAGIGNILEILSSFLPIILIIVFYQFYLF